jgi:hypothetical protein
MQMAICWCRTCGISASAKSHRLEVRKYEMCVFVCVFVCAKEEERRSRRTEKNEDVDEEEVHRSWLSGE